MNPQTGAPDASDLLRTMGYWLRGSPPGVFPRVQGEQELQQAITNRARLDRITALVAAAYPGVAPTSQVDPTLPAWLVRAGIYPGPVVRQAGQDGCAHFRVELSITNSPLGLTFRVAPTMPEANFRALVRSQYAVIAAAAS
jgi:hypothetical protein